MSRTTEVLGHRDRHPIAAGVIGSVDEAGVDELVEMVDQVRFVSERLLDQSERDRALDDTEPTGERRATGGEKCRCGVEHRAQTVLPVGQIDRARPVEQRHALTPQPVEQGHRCEMTEAAGRDLDRQGDPPGELADLHDRRLVSGEVDVGAESAGAVDEQQTGVARTGVGCRVEGADRHHVLGADAERDPAGDDQREPRRRRQQRGDGTRQVGDLLAVVGDQHEVGVSLGEARGSIRSRPDRCGLAHPLHRTRRFDRRRQVGEDDGIARRQQAMTDGEGGRGLADAPQTDERDQPRVVGHQLDDAIDLGGASDHSGGRLGQSKRSRVGRLGTCSGVDAGCDRLQRPIEDLALERGEGFRGIEAELLDERRPRP